MEIYINCKDHTVSKETFSLRYDPKTEMLITEPIPHDLEKYYESEDYISHTDSNKSLLDKIYQAVKHLNIRFKLNLIHSYTGPNKKLLDVGAGTGDFLVAAQKKGWTILGVEPNKNAIEKAKAKKITLVPTLKSVAKEKFDIITLWHVLEHLTDLDSQIANLVELLENKGSLIIAVPNYRSYDANHYKEHWAAYDVPRHLWHFSKTSIERIFLKHNMKVVRTRPMLFDAFYVSLLSEKYKSGKTNVLKAIWAGFRSNLSGLFTKEYSSHIYILKKI